MGCFNSALLGRRIAVQSQESYAVDTSHRTRLVSIQDIEGYYLVVEDRNKLTIDSNGNTTTFRTSAMPVGSASSASMHHTSPFSEKLPWKHQLCRHLLTGVFVIVSDQASSMQFDPDGNAVSGPS